MKIKLYDVIEALDFVNQETQYYYSIKTEEILMVWDGMVNGEYEPELIEAIEESFDEYIALPSQYEIDEYSMMEEFAENLPDNRKQKTENRKQKQNRKQKTEKYECFPSM